MTKKWNNAGKLVVTSIAVAAYVTIGFLNSAILNGERRRNIKPAAADRDSATVKTIVGYSMEFRLREEMRTEEIDCSDASPRPPDTAPAGGWTHDRHLRIRAFSAYYDARLEPYNYVRIIALVPRNTSFYCQMWYEKNDKESYVIRKAVVHEIWSVNWGRYENSCHDAYPSVISCPAPAEEEHGREVPRRVSFVDKSCRRSNVSIAVEESVREGPGSRGSKAFVVCVKALNYTDHANRDSLVEWIELNAMLGAGKIVVYVTTLDGADMNILERYAKKNVVEVRRFEPVSCASGNYEQHLWRKRKMEIIAYNDCFYRNLNNAKFVVPLDIDEVIVPKTGRNWREAFVSHFDDDAGNEDWPTALDKYSSFSVRNVYFFREYPRQASATLPGGVGNVSAHAKLVRSVKRQQALGPGDSIFKRILRSSAFSPESDSVKSFVHVPKALSVFNHYAFHVLGDATRQYIFPESLLQLNHYRSRCDPELIDGCRNYLDEFTVDESLQRFRKLIPRDALSRET